MEVPRINYKRQYKQNFRENYYIENRIVNKDLQQTYVPRVFDAITAIAQENNNALRTKRTAV